MKRKFKQRWSTSEQPSLFCCQWTHTHKTRNTPPSKEEKNMTYGVEDTYK